jgi:hypothetical protein
MAQLAEVCYPGRKERPARRPRSIARRRALVDLHSLAEEMLCEMAFVYQATRSIRESMAEDAAQGGPA